MKRYAPIKDVKLRAGYNRAVRAPSVGDLFSPAVIGAGGEEIGRSLYRNLGQCQLKAGAAVGTAATATAPAEARVGDIPDRIADHVEGEHG